MALSIPTGVLASRYAETVDAMISQVNQGSITLVYVSPELVPSNQTYLAPGSFDRYGGRVPINSMDEGMNASDRGVSYKENTVQETLPCRVYWNPRNVNNDFTPEELKTLDPSKLVKVNCYTSYKSKILSAAYFLIKDQRFVLAKTPLHYGLFGQQYLIVYFKQEMVNGKT